MRFTLIRYLYQPYDTTPGVPPDAMSWFSRTDRPTNEIKQVASASGNAHVTNAGIENLTVLGGADGQIRFENAAPGGTRSSATCWAAPVR